MNKISILLVLILIFTSCGGSDTTILTIEDTTTTTVAPSTTTTVQDTTTTTVQDTTTTTVEDTTTTTTSTTTTIPNGTYLDYRDVKYFKVANVGQEHVDKVKGFLEYAESVLFADERTKFQNLYPIHVVQLDEGNYQSAVDLEVVYCDYLAQNFSQNANGYGDADCSPERIENDGCSDNYCLFASNGQVEGASIIGSPLGKDNDCCYLFLSATHSSLDDGAYGHITMHEMVHIFQMSNWVDLATSQTVEENIAGRIIDGSSERYNHNNLRPFWSEGVAVYFGYLYWSRAINNNNEFKDYLVRDLTSTWAWGGDQSSKDKYLNDGVKLYDITFGGDFGLAYDIGGWFVAYLVHNHGEDQIWEYYYNAQSGIYFEQNFLQTFGKDYRVYVDEFEDFLRNSDTDALRAILPDN